MLVCDYDNDANEGKAADYSLLSKNTIDTDTTAKDGDEDKFEQENIEIFWRRRLAVVLIVTISK